MQSEFNNNGTSKASDEDILYKHDYLVSLLAPKRRRKTGDDEDRLECLTSYMAAEVAVDHYFDMKQAISENVQLQARSRHSTASSNNDGVGAFDADQELGMRLADAYCSIRRSLGFNSLEDYYFTKLLGSSWSAVDSAELSTEQVVVYGSIYKYVTSTKQLDEDSFLASLNKWTEGCNGRILNYDNRGHLAMIYHHVGAVGSFMEHYYKIKPICLVLEHKAFQELIRLGFFSTKGRNHYPNAISSPRVIDQGLLVVGC